MSVPLHLRAWSDKRGKGTIREAFRMWLKKIGENPDQPRTSEEWDNLSARFLRAPVKG